MQYKGADIRIIGVPIESTVELVRVYISTQGWQIIGEDADAERVLIRAAGSIDSYFKCWRHGGPQRVEWRHSKLSDGTTKLETRFGLHPQFRCWFWSVLITLAGVFYLLYETGGHLVGILCAEHLQRVACQWWLGGAMMCLMVLLLPSCLVFAKVSISHNIRYRAVVEALNGALRRRHGKFNQKILQSDYLFPDIFQVFFFFLANGVFFLGREGLQQGWVFLNLPLVWFMILLIGLLVALLILGHVYAGFKERLHFIIPVIALLLPVLLLGGLPHLNLYLHNWAAGQHSLPTGFIAFLTAVANMVWISVIAILFAGSSTLARILKHQRKTFFVPAAPGSTYRQALDFSPYSTPFVTAVLIFFIVMTPALYWALYVVLAVFELGVSNQNHLFVCQAGKGFFQNLNFICGSILPPEQFGGLAAFSARLLAVGYSGPLLWIILKVVQRRTKTCRRNARLFKAYRKGAEMSQYRDMIKRCRRLAVANGIKPPEMVITPSSLPDIRAIFMGVPYFASVIFMSQGCFKLSADELEGLIAHEMFHVQNHSLKWYLLNLLSDFTLFGTGFLAVLTNSYANELAADKFAANWIAAQGIPVTEYIQALEIMALATDATERSGGSGGLEIHPQNKKSAGLKRKPNSRQKLKDRFRFLFELYFGEEILSYIHPPLAERIAVIKALTGSCARNRSQKESVD